MKPRYKFSVLKHIFGVVLNIVSFQESLVLLSERLSAMMLFLILHIGFHLFHDRSTDREHRIATLPCELRIIWGDGLNPFAAAFLDILHEVGHGDCPWKGAEDMDMVGDAAYLDDHCVLVDDDAIDVGKQLGEVFFANGDGAVFGVEDQMDIDLCE